jgi:hypothetical protein
MLRNTTLALAIAVMFAAAASAATIQITSTHVPTPGLSGFSTYTVHAHSSAPMQVFDFAGDGTPDPQNGRGFYGAMNQIVLFGGAISTIYNDNNAVIDSQPGQNHSQDSQFLVKSTDVVVPAGFSKESNTYLLGIWSHSAPVGNDADIAQLVIPTTGSAPPIVFRGVISTLENGTFVDNPVSGFVPEPATLALVGLAMVGLVGFCRRK